MNEKPILNLSSKFKQIVDFPTRLNPDRILDKVVTSLSHWYQPPVPLPPLECDSDKTGRPSDHLGVLWEPLNHEFPAREMRTVHFRPLPDSSIKLFGRWVASNDWSDIYNAETAHEKATFLQTILMEKFNYFFPEKISKFRFDDKPWVTTEVKYLDCKRRRAWVKDKNSCNYNTLNTQYQELCKTSKNKFYQKTIKDLKSSNISQ